MKELFKLTSDVRKARKHAERATAARNEIFDEWSKLLDENMTGLDTETYEKNSQRIDKLRADYESISAGTYVYPKAEPDIGKFFAGYRFFTIYRRMFVIVAWALFLALAYWVIF